MLLVTRQRASPRFTPRTAILGRLSIATSVSSLLVKGIVVIHVTRFMYSSRLSSPLEDVKGQTGPYQRLHSSDNSVSSGMTMICQSDARDYASRCHVRVMQMWRIVSATGRRRVVSCTLINSAAKISCRWSACRRQRRRRRFLKQPPNSIRILRR